MDAADAVKVAKDYLTRTFGEDLSGVPRLDEVWLDETKGLWFVGLTMRLAEDRTFGDLAHDPLGLSSLPKYKLMSISHESGQALAIRNRDEVPF
jgi:hypothetical protein